MHEAIRQRTRSAVLNPTGTRPRTRVRDDALALAEARYKAGATLCDLAADLGVSRPQVASLLRARGVRLRRQSPSSKDVVEMKHRYEAGESLERIGTRLGFSPGTVRNHLLAEGIVMRDSQGQPG